LKRYEYAQFWQQKGKEPAEKYSTDKKIAILEALCSLKFDSVLEIGAGDGELTKIITEYFKPRRYLAIDLSDDRLSRIDLPIEKRQADILSFETDEKFDLVISAHTLLHIEPENIRKVMQKMYHFSKKYVVNIDPIHFSIEGTWTYYNFPHDYFHLWGEIADYSFNRIEDRVGLWKVEK